LNTLAITRADNASLGSTAMERSWNESIKCLKAVGESVPIGVAVKLSLLPVRGVEESKLA